MVESKYGKYFISNPRRIEIGELAHHNMIKERNGESLEYLNNEILPEAKVFSAVSRTWGPPDPQPYHQPHKHDVDEIIYFLALNPDGILGAEVEFHIGDEAEKHKITRNTLVYIPKGLIHCPIYFEDYQKNRQFYLLSVLLKSNYY